MFLEDQVSLMAGIATLNSTLFLGAKPSIPGGNGPYMTISETGGSGCEYVQNQAGPAYEYASAQFLVRANAYPLARAMAQAAYDAVTVVHNQTVNGVWYLWIRAMQGPFDLGLDAEDRSMIAFNIMALKRPS